MKDKRDEAFNRSLASSGATLIAFIGVVHEVAGHLIFPWGPSALGGPVGWHGLGLLGIVTGFSLLGGTLGVIRFPVVPVAVLVATLALVIASLTAVFQKELHLFALLAFGAGCLTAFSHRAGEACAARA